jgi:hypothetical protein
MRGLGPRILISSTAMSVFGLDFGSAEDAFRDKGFHEAGHHLNADRTELVSKTRAGTLPAC